MEKKNNKYTALLNVMKRELRRLVSRPLYLFCMVIAPLFCYIFFTTLMDSGLPTDMPVGVVDRDMTATSRQLVRNLDAFEQTAVVARYPDISDARIAMQKGEIYGFYYIPEGTAAKAQAQRQPKVSFYTNNTNDIAETKTYLYNYDYETDSNGEVHTDYHEEKPSVDLNESHEEVEPTVNFKKGAVTYVKMNETYNSGACECTVLKAYSTVSKQFCADTFGEEYSQLLLDYLNKFRGYYDENGNLFNEGHRFFLVKMHLKYSGKTTSKIQFTSPIICKYPDGTYYSLGLLGFIDRALSENSTCHLTLNPDDEFDAWFLYEASRYSHDKTYYLRGSFQNYIDDDSYTGYLVELNDIEDVE